MITSSFVIASKKFDHSDTETNPIEFGEDLAKYLLAKLKSRGILINPEPFQADWGWMIDFELDNINYWIGLGYYEDEGFDNSWYCFVKTRQKGIINKLFKKNPKISINVLKSIDGFLKDDSEIEGVKWYTEEDWMKGRTESFVNIPKE